MSLHYDGLPLALGAGEGMTRGTWFATWIMRRPGTTGCLWERVGGETFLAVCSGWADLTNGTPRQNWLMLTDELQYAADKLRKPIRGDS